MLWKDVNQSCHLARAEVRLAKKIPDGLSLAKQLEHPVETVTFDGHISFPRWGGFASFVVDGEPIALPGHAVVILKGEYK